MAAHLSTSLSASSKAPVKFNIITSAQGEYYDDAFGTFTCPVDGDYFVSSTLRKSSGNSNSWSMSIKRATGQYVAYAAEDSNRYGGTLSTSAVVHCPALSKMWVEVGGSVSIKGDFTVPYSSFNVYLLKADIK